jgi:glycerol kinase
MKVLLALDQGTTSSRAIVFGEDGSIRAVAQREFRQIFPRPGWVEHDAMEIWSTQLGIAVEALERAGLRPSDVAALGIANQRETTLLWDRGTGEPIGNAIVWQDRRTAGVCDELRATGHEPLFRERTGLVLDAYFSGTKVAWLLDNVPGARARAERGELAFGTIDTWLAYKLSGGKLHVTDASNASRTLLFDIRKGAWDDELCRVLRVPPAVLPEVRATSEIVGEAVGPLAGVPIASLVGDQQAALAGQAGFEPGAAKNTYGTGCFLLVHTGTVARPSPSGLVTTVAARIAGETTYALEGSVFSGGATIQWLRDGLRIVERAADVEALAAGVPDAGDVYLVPAFVGLGAPHWDGYARGAIVGLTRGTTAAHLARAALEGIAHQVADLFEAMERDAGVETKALRVDGGASANALLLQIQADLLQIPVVRPTCIETTALGAAYLAGLAAGVYRTLDDVRHGWKVEATFEPRMPASRARELRARWAQAVERAKGWARP